MTLITIVFDYPDIDLPKYKFGDRVAICSSHPPKDWRTGKVVGFRWQEDRQVGWYYSVRLDEPFVYTEEYSEGELVESAKISLLQAQWEQEEVALMQQNLKVTSEIPTPKFQAKSLVKFSQETGCDLLGGCAEVIGSRYVCSEDWSSWVYELKNEHLTQPLEVGEIWLELVSPNSAEARQIKG